jgi:hypothetical protein
MLSDNSSFDVVNLARPTAAAAGDHDAVPEHHRGVPAQVEFESRSSKRYITL